MRDPHAGKYGELTPSRQRGGGGFGLRSTLFREVGACFDLVLIGLDLSALYRDEGRSAELEELAAETYRQFRGLSADAEAIAALKLWKEAIDRQELEDEVLSEVGKQLTARIPRHQAPDATPRRRRKR